MSHSLTNSQRNVQEHWQNRKAKRQLETSLQSSDQRAITTFVPTPAQSPPQPAQAANFMGEAAFHVKNMNQNVQGVEEQLQAESRVAQSALNAEMAGNAAGENFRVGMIQRFEVVVEG